MAIRIVRNDAGNCITFEGTENPIYWNACLSAELNATDANNINIVNDIRTAQSTINKYEFFNIPFAQFEDRDGNQFADAQAVVDYINQQANVVGTSTVGTDLTGIDVNFRLDQTNTTIIVDNGLQYGANSIKAVPHTDGTIHINAIGSGVPTGTEDADDRVHLEKIEVGRVYIDGLQVTGGLNDVANALNELFQVGAFESVVISDPHSTMVADVSGTVTTTAYVGSGLDPIGADVYGSSATGNLNGYKTTDTISQAGEYFSFDIRNESIIGFGLIHTQASYDAGYYSGSATYANPATFGTSNSAHYGFQFSHWFHPTPNGPWTNYGANTGYVMGSGWSSSTLGFRYSAEGAEWLAGNPVKMRVGIDANSFISIDYYDVSTSSWVVCARTSYPIVQGAEFVLGIKTNDTVARVASVPKVHLLEATAPTMYFRYIESPDGNFNYPLFATAEEANYYDLNNGGTGTSHTHVYVDDPSFSTWYMPDNGQFMNQTSAPAGTETFLGNLINWTEITTLTDAAFAPTAYTDNTVTVDELSAINVQVVPADASFTTTVTDVNGAGVSLVGTNIQGTAPEVTGDNQANPSDDYLVRVTRTNSYGSSTGILTITVNNLTAPVIVPITGFTHEATSTALIDSDTLDNGSVVYIDETVDNKRRFIVAKSWVESYVLPALEENTTVTLGVANGSPVWTDGADTSDFDIFIQWERTTGLNHYSRLGGNGLTTDEMLVNSLTDGFYDYAFEVDDTEVIAIACNINSINTEPSVNNGGSFSRTLTKTGTTAPITLHFGLVGGTSMDIATTGLSEIVIPAADNWVQVTESGNVLSFDGSTTFPTLQAGSTYRLLVGDTLWSDQTTLTGIKSTEIIKFTADGTTEYTMGGTWTQSGTVGVDFAYIEFTVPTDAPPLHWYASAAHNPISTDSAYAVAISGSTYVVPVTGITLEGPSANQTGTNVMDQYEHGWISLNEQLSAGERLVLDNAFFADFLDATKDTNNIFAIGLKGNNWTNTTEINSNGAGAAVQNSETFRGNTYIVGIWNSGASALTMWIFADNQASNSFYMNSPSNYATTCAFLEITSDGNNIRVGMGRNNSTGNITQGDESTVPYADWNAYKGETNNRTLGISSIDVVMSFWTFDGGAIDGNDIDWTGLSEINIPVPAPANTTANDYALQLTGGSEYLRNGSNNSAHNVLYADGVLRQTLPTSGQTLGSSLPWVVSIMFSLDSIGSGTEYLWYKGELNTTNSDEIAVRRNASNELVFEWGRNNVGYNVADIATLTTGKWYTLTVVYLGPAWSGTNATTSNLNNTFKFYLNTANASNVLSASSTQITPTWSQTGQRMDRVNSGFFYIGGRASNRSLNAKVAQLTATTLLAGSAVPTLTELDAFAKDPEGWATDYKVGNSYRSGSSVLTNWQSGTNDAGFTTYGYLMGDAPSYAFPVVKNIFNTADTNTQLTQNAMVSSDKILIQDPR